MVRRASWVIAVAIFLVGGGAEASLTPAEAAYFPRHDSVLGTGHLALLEGPLVFGDGCLWIKPSGGERHLILWPSNTTLGKINDLPVVLGPDHELLAETGSVARLGGRFTDLDQAQELVGPIPMACSGEAFWIAGTVENRP